MHRRTALLAGVILIGSTAFVCAGDAPGGSAQAAGIAPNDNRRPAGELRNGVLAIHLTAGAGTWYPEGRDGPGREGLAFGEAGRGLMNPGPLIRVPVGTEIRATVRNEIAGATLTVHGLYDRPGAAAPIRVPPLETHEVRFRVSAVGTYYYWATTSGAATVRARQGSEGQLMGALIVDPPDAVADDHILVLGIDEEGEPGAPPADRHLKTAVINGLMWPHTPRYGADVGDTVRIRVINPTSRPHPMHLHGAYFTVESYGTIDRDTAYGPDARRLVVTEFVNVGNTMTMTWVPERPGNWLFHCHMAEHMSPELRQAPRQAHAPGQPHNHTLDAMAGLVTGWQVRPTSIVRHPDPDSAAARRQLRLLVQAAPGRYGTEPGLGFVLHDGATEPRGDSVAIPGPPIVLTRGEPVQITVVNRLAEPTSIHWHGMELDSYYDGVSGWSGIEGRISPQVEPRDSFIVRFTPPRAGTFIYHSHFEEQRQLYSGMYGPLIVLDPGAPYDPVSDQTWVLAQGGPGKVGPVVLNGAERPELNLDAGRRYRIRLININPNVPLRFSVLADSVPVRWRAIAKDGADLPVSQARMRAAQQLIGVGETYDFEFTPENPGNLRLLATNQPGVVFLTGIVRVRAPGPG